MLLIHPDSTCDVCLDPYSWATSDNTPHAISCGHVFCNTCLNHLRPPHCPLCRKAFTADRVKKLHVDRYDPSPTNDTENEARELMDRIALNSGENTARETVEEILNEAKRWLDRDGHSSTYPAVHAAFSVLVRYRSLLEVRSDHERELSELRARLHRRRAMEEEDQMNSTLIEQNLVRELTEREETIASLKRRLAFLEDTRDDGQRFRNPLPRPPQPSTYAFQAAEAASSSFDRGSVPPPPVVYKNNIFNSTAYERSSVPQIHYKGVSYAPGAPPEQRVVPERTRSRVGHREREEREPRAHHRTEADREARREQRRRKEEERAARQRGRDAEEGEDTILSIGQILPGNALGIGPTPGVSSRGTDYIYAPRTHSGQDATAATPAPAPHNSLGLSANTSDDRDASFMPGSFPSNTVSFAAPTPHRAQPMARSSMASVTSMAPSWGTPTAQSSTSNFFANLTGLNTAPDPHDDSRSDVFSASEGQLLGVRMDNRPAGESTPSQPPYIYRPPPSRAAGFDSGTSVSRPDTTTGDRRSSHSRSRAASISSRDPASDAENAQRGRSGTDSYFPYSASGPAALPAQPYPGWPYAPGYPTSVPGFYGTSATSLHSQRSGQR